MRDQTTTDKGHFISGDKMVVSIVDVSTESLNYQFWACVPGALPFKSSVFASGFVVLLCNYLHAISF